jgi:hypothetical protein
LNFLTCGDAETGRADAEEAHRTLLREARTAVTQNPADDPRWSPNIRNQVETAINAVLFEAQDILRRYSDDGIYVPPSEVAEGGSINGLMAASRHQVLERLSAKIEEARQVFADVERQQDQQPAS